MRDLIGAEAVAAGLASLEPGWSGTSERLRRELEFADFLTAVRFIDLIAPRCEELDHHPDLTLSWRRVGITLTTHSAGGVTELDLRLAAEIDRVAATLDRVG